MCRFINDMRDELSAAGLAMIDEPRTISGSMEVPPGFLARSLNASGSSNSSLATQTLISGMLMTPSRASDVITIQGLDCARLQTFNGGVPGKRSDPLPVSVVDHDSLLSAAPALLV